MSTFSQSTVGYFVMPMWLNCGLKIYLAETVMEEITLFINLEIKKKKKKAIRSHIILQVLLSGPLHWNIKRSCIFHNTAFVKQKGA